MRYTFIWLLSVALAPLGTADEVVFPLKATPEQMQTLANILKLEVSLSMDRKQYFPGEDCLYTITIHNPTTTPLPVQSAFKQTEGIDWMEKDSPRAKELGTDYWYMGWHPYSQRQKNPYHPAIVIGAGETITRTFSSMDQESQRIQFPRGAPRKPGAYRSVFSYNPRTAHFDFEVSPATLVAVQSVSLGNDSVTTYEGQTVDSPRRVFAFVLSTGEEQFLCVSATIERGHPSIPKPGEAIHGSFDNYRRIQELNGPIADLELTVDHRKRVKVRWRESVNVAIRQQERDVELVRASRR
jgi:hypothetical protein